MAIKAAKLKEKQLDEHHYDQLMLKIRMRQGYINKRQILHHNLKVLSDELYEAKERKKRLRPAPVIKVRASTYMQSTESLLRRSINHSQIMKENLSTMFSVKN